MKKSIRDILKTPFLKSLVILSGGAILAQVFNFLCSIAMAYQYSKSEIGYFTYILSLVAMFSNIINGRYDVPIVSGEKQDVNALVKISWYICLPASIVIAICSFFYIANTQKDYQEYLYLSIWVFPLLLVAGIINILNAYNNRFGEYKLISGAYLVRTIFQSVLTICLGFWKATAFILLLSQFLGQFFGMGKQSARIRNEYKNIQKTTRKEIYEALKKYRRQPLFSVPATLVNAVSYSLISLIIGNYYGMEILALYSVSVRILGLPLSIFSTNVAKIHFKDATNELQTTGKFIKSTSKMTLFSLILAIFMVIVLMLFAPTLFSWIYGQPWIESGVYVRILAPMFALRMMVGAIGYGFIIANEQRKEFIFQLALLIVGIGVFIAAKYLLWTINNLLIVISLSYSIIYLIELITIIIISNKENNLDEKCPYTNHS